MENSIKKENPYLNRNAVLDPKEFYGRAIQIKNIMEAITSETPQCSSITGTTKSGKTSIFRFIDRNNDNNRYGIDWEGIRQNYRFVYIDFGYYQPKGIDEFFQVIYRGVIGPSAQAGKIDTPDRVSIEKVISEHINTSGQKFVFLLDEFEAVINNPEMASEA